MTESAVAAVRRFQLEWDGGVCPKTLQNARDHFDQFALC